MDTTRTRDRCPGIVGVLRRWSVAMVAGALLVTACGEERDVQPATPAADETASAPPASGVASTPDTTVPAPTTGGPETTTIVSTIPVTVESTTSPSLSSEPTVTTTMPAVNALPVPTAAQSLAPRDCYSVDADNRARLVPCEQLHDGQVVQTGVELVGLDPMEASVDIWRYGFVATCREDFEFFTGSDLDDGAAHFTVAAVVTSQLGAPVVVSCTAVRADGEQWAGTAEQVVGAYSGIDVGECFDFPTPDSNADRLPCDVPHEAEMFLVDAGLGIDAVDAPYPTHDEWAAMAASICNVPFGVYTGRSLGNSGLAYVYIFTLESDWDVVSSRQLSCAVVNVDGTRLVGSTRAV